MMLKRNPHLYCHSCPQPWPHVDTDPFSVAGDLLLLHTYNLSSLETILGLKIVLQANLESPFEAILWVMVLPA